MKVNRPKQHILGPLRVDHSIPVPIEIMQRAAFVGEVHFASGEHVGIELEEAVGNCDGTVEGKTYFICEANVRLPWYCAILALNLEFCMFVVRFCNLCVFTQLRSMRDLHLVALRSVAGLRCWVLVVNVIVEVVRPRVVEIVDGWGDLRKHTSRNLLL